MTVSVGQFFRPIKNEGESQRPPCYKQLHIVSAVAPNRIALICLTGRDTGKRFQVYMTKVKSIYDISPKEWKRITDGYNFERVYKKDLKKYF